LPASYLAWIIRKLDTSEEFNRLYSEYRMPCTMTLAAKSPAHLDIEIEADDDSFAKWSKE